MCPVAAIGCKQEATVREGEKLYDFGNYPEIHSHDLADVQFIGTKIRFVMFDWFKSDGVWQRRVVGTIDRALSTVPTEQATFFQRLAKDNIAPAQQIIAMH